MGVAITVGLIGTATPLLVVGPGALGGWFQSTLRLGVQPHPTYSAYGVGLELFSDNGAMAAPLMVSPLLQWGVTGLVAVAVCALLGLALVRPGDADLALWHVTGCVLLLLSTSHGVYLILLVPIMLCHLARMQSNRRSVGRWDLVVGLLAATWWVLAMRLWSDATLGPYVVTVGATLVMLTASVAAEAFRPSPALAADPGSTAGHVRITR